MPIEHVPALLASGKWTVIAGLFDPMTAVQAQRIAQHQEAGCKLLTVVLEDDKSLLSADARAALIAALRTVDAVSIARAEQWPVAAEEIDAERARRDEFVHFVVERGGAGR